MRVHASACARVHVRVCMRAREFILPIKGSSARACARQSSVFLRKYGVAERDLPCHGLLYEMRSQRVYRVLLRYSRGLGPRLRGPKGPNLIACEFPQLKICVCVRVGRRGVCMNQNDSQPRRGALGPRLRGPRAERRTQIPDLIA